MRILHTTAELFPYVKVGGLSDMLASLSKTQAKENEVFIALPLIRNIRGHIEFTGRELSCISPHDSYGSNASNILENSKFREAKAGDVKLYFFDSPIFRDLYTIYENANEHYNFAVFSYACFHLAEQLEVSLIHSHDWHTALCSVISSTRPEGFPTCFTIHNMSHQGDHPFEMTGFLRSDPFFLIPENLEHLGKVNYMRGALQHAQEITTVSPGYRDEILSEPNGYFLSWLLQQRQDSLTGILNGIDEKEWNPELDKKIYFNYNKETVKEGKHRNKLALYQEYGLHIDINRPLIGSVGRLSYQKGIATFLNSFFWKWQLPFYYFVLGTGDVNLENALFEQSHHNHQRLYFYRGFSEDLARKVEAASDFFIMPSLFEPCGLNQLYSHAYGTIPIVSRVGGLKDTVHESYEIEHQTGLVFEPGQDHSLNYAMERANSLYYDKPKFDRVRQNVMSQDWTWTNRVKEYRVVYERAISKKIRVKPFE